MCIVNATLPPVYGGAEIAAYRYAERLHGAGVEVVLIAPDSDSRASSQALPAYVHGLRMSLADPRRQRSRLWGRPELVLTEIAGRLWPRMWALRQEFDILHIFNSASLFNLMAVPCARLLGKPVVLEMSLLGSDDPLTLRERRPPRRRRLWKRPPLRYLLYRLADVYVSKSAPLTAAYRRARLPERKLVHIPYGVDTELFRPAPEAERASLRRKLGLDPQGSVVLFVGGVNKRKGVHWLLEAFRQVRASHPACTLLLVGPTEKYEAAYVEGLHRDAERWGLRGSVRFLHGLATNVHEYMRAADVFTLPTVREGLPISVLEAMASGLAVVASDIPEIADSQIRNGEEGLLVPVGDVTALAAALCCVLGDGELRERLGRAARARAVGQFSAEVVDQQYHDLYARLLNASPSESGHGSPRAGG